MQCTFLKLSSRRGSAFATSLFLHASSQNMRAADAAQRIEVEEFAKSYQMKPMADHPRSSFEYKSSAKGAEVGARNEAAFMNYETFTPQTLSGRLVMPGDINLLTVSPLYCALLCIAAAAWGVFYWDMYCRKNYETVLIARPKDMQ
ncbi:SDH10 / Succinate dehydrogenase subunit 10 [Leishmania donovani]|uniref:Uncharacterized protein n=3 Tax=Leishmania donovani species complex TaxID=38574 RepID=A4HSM5_LEIIN|nr:conserved hypothetical protein [Leishmania infantum JPCM5]XP_003858290.1 hypothetical protein, conserved [Leishmania donovani]CAC9444228.1 hypothetical_protein_-_conserved [Leishmania infantum]AYU76009.1 hypothetical protein LdCL_050015600 [Leishmania donovani]TPP44107.1 hypothetical protein CGC21_9720 [Leishmania donovani]CAJ1986075.1 SDH10 / Succinate dehydrogenase subunit 10 [Leishmania donovani]CAM65413.1 conserved hypothetical protein [Leishmania infantum JPCM5]|eukprot:XP_001463066.1 conserved hypothetical protein [Leishmania infantum JPCM5]